MFRSTLIFASRLRRLDEHFMEFVGVINYVLYNIR